MLSSYPIGRPTRTCASTGRPLTTGEHYVAALIEQPGAASPVRVDYSIEAWDAALHSTPLVPTDQLIAYWRGVVPDPTLKVKPVLDDDALLDLFEQTAGEDLPAPEAQPDAQPDANASVKPSASRAAVRFVLAILLVRRRLLSQEGSAPGGIVKLRRKGDPRPPEGPPLLEVTDPGLDESTLAEVLMQLEDLGAVSPAGAGA